MTDGSRGPLPPFLEEVAEGVLVTVHVQPRSGRRVVDGVHGGALRLRVQEPAVDGRANEGARRLLADTLGMAPSRVELRSGARSRLKRFLVVGGDGATIGTTLAALEST